MDLAEKFRDVAARGEQPAQRRLDAQDLRRRAEELLKNASPQDLERLGRIAKQWQQNGTGSSPPGAQDGKAFGSDHDLPGALPPDVGAADARQAEARGSRPGASGDASGDGSGQPGIAGQAGVGRGPRMAVPKDATPLEDRRRERVDARGNAPRDGGAGERVIAEWLGGPRNDGGISAASGGFQQGMQEAAAGVERAIEQQAVPNHYTDLVRRVFKRYVDRVTPQVAPPVAPAAPSPAPPPTKESGGG